MELWKPKHRIEVTFRRSLLEIAKQIIMRIGETTDMELINSTLLHISKSREYQNFCESIAMNMVTHLYDDQGKTWRQAASLNSKGGFIYAFLQKELKGSTGRMLMQEIQRNAEIIKTLPLNIAQDVTAYVAKESLKGRRASEIAKEIKLRFPKQTKARAELIARTEVSKTQSNLIESRCRKFNINWYIWRPVGGSRGDGRTRTSHKGMAGVLVNWNEPPAPEDLFPIYGKHGKKYRNSLGHYHAGCCPNCRCYAEPVIDLDLLAFPLRIYRKGSIYRINRKAFIKLLGKKG